MGPGTFHDARILMVDDQEVNLALLDDLLGQAGYTNLKGITDPRATLATLTAFQPD